jgi:uncharacterized protein DUF3987
VSAQIHEVRCQTGDHVFDSLDRTAVDAHDLQHDGIMRVSRGGWEPTGAPATTPSAAPEPDVIERVAEAEAEAPTLDSVALYGVLGRIVAALQDHTEANPAAILAALLVYFGAIAGEGHSIYQGGVQAPRLFGAVVGPTSAGRKGTALDLAEEVFDLVARGDVARLSISGAGSGEGLIRSLIARTTSPKGKDGNPDPNFVPDPRAIVNEPEFARFLRAMSWKGSTLGPNFCKAWDGKPLEHTTMAAGVLRATSHHVGAIVAITREVLRKELTDEDANSGFANRFLWVWTGPSEVLHPHTTPALDLIDLADIQALGSAIDWARNRRDDAAGSTSGRVAWTWSEEARAHWESNYRKRGDAYGVRAAITQRADPQVARLALVYALTDGKRELPLTIELRHLQAAEAFWAYCRQSVAVIFGDSTGNRNADALLRALRRGDGRMNRLAVRDALGLRAAADIDDAIRVLVDVGLIEEVIVTRAGRPLRGIQLVGLSTMESGRP